MSNTKKQLKKMSIIPVIVTINLIAVVTLFVLFFILKSTIEYQNDIDSRSILNTRVDLSSLRYNLDKAGVLPNNEITEQFCRNTWTYWVEDQVATNRACTELLAELDALSTDDNNEQ